MEGVFTNVETRWHKTCEQQMKSETAKRQKCSDPKEGKKQDK